MLDKTEYVRNKLKTTKDKLDTVAFLSGVGRRTISNIMHSDISPNTATIEKLYSYFKPEKVKK